MFSAPVQPTRTLEACCHPPPASRRDRARKKPSYLPLFIALGVLLVIAIAIILFFALRK